MNSELHRPSLNCRLLHLLEDGRKERKKNFICLRKLFAFCFLLFSYALAILMFHFFTRGGVGDKIVFKAYLMFRDKDSGGKNVMVAST